MNTPTGTSLQNSRSKGGDVSGSRAEEEENSSVSLPSITLIYFITGGIKFQRNITPVFCLVSLKKCAQRQNHIMQQIPHYAEKVRRWTEKQTYFSSQKLQVTS